MPVWINRKALHQQFLAPLSAEDKQAFIDAIYLGVRQHTIDARLNHGHIQYRLEDVERVASEQRDAKSVRGDTGRSEDRADHGAGGASAA